MATHCPGCMPRRTALALSLATIATPTHALDAIEPRFRRSPAPDGHRRIALTLDACNGGFDRRIADAIVAHHARATIFLTADWIRQNPAGLAFLRAHPGNFRFENHGQHHRPAILGTGTIWGLRIAGTLEGVRQEVQAGAEAILAATGTATSWYRAAAARYSPAAIPEITRLGHAIAAFTVNADEGASLPATAVATRAAAARNGDILIGHINQPHRPSGQGWAQAIAALAQSGVTWSDLDTMRPLLQD